MSVATLNWKAVGRIFTMNLQTMLKTKLAAGHSGQKRTTRRSEIRLSRMVRYSASFAFFVDLLFPDLKHRINQRSLYH